MKKLLPLVTALIAFPALAADINIQWAPNAAANAVQGYNVRAYSGTTTNAPMVFNRQFTSTTAVVTNLVPGTYLIRVNAFNVWGEGLDGPQSVLNLTGTRPDAVVGLQIVP